VTGTQGGKQVRGLGGSDPVTGTQGGKQVRGLGGSDPVTGTQGGKRVLLTGASGFIGSHAIGSLRRRGFEVHAVGSRHIPNADAADAAEWHRVDLLDPKASRAMVERLRPSHLLHLAWYAEHGLFWSSTENVRWVEASLGLLRAFNEAGGERAVMAGTCAEYDWTAAGRYIEGVTPLAPATLYGTCKHALHQVAEAWCAQVASQFAWGRIFLLYGPREHPARLVASVARAVLAGAPAPCSHGRQLRDFLHSADVADAFAALLDSQVCGAVNIGSGEAVGVAELVERVASSAGHPELVRLGELPPREGEPAELVADVGRLRKEVGWSPRMTLEQGIEQTVAWWREQLRASPAEADDR
jgi:nucleoside-diphosphate-sugar epimerase